ncbi:MAG: retropepsin-like domain-containing protein [Treponema sp.]|jgi:predicted aspartyl protease|nr:retropepsin-like domain-containing protein [Treponema sp.]
MPRTPHFAFKQDNPFLARQLITEAYVFTPDKKASFKARALWDTGATGTVITPEIANALNLEPFDRLLISGVNNTDFADLVHISVGLPNQVMCDDFDAVVCSLNKKIDMLIGMDIILNGDLSISNAGGRTLFTFAIPPFENKTDLYEKTIATNKRNKL